MELLLAPYRQVAADLARVFVWTADDLARVFAWTADDLARGFVWMTEASVERFVAPYRYLVLMHQIGTGFLVWGAGCVALFVALFAACPPLMDALDWLSDLDGAPHNSMRPSRLLRHTLAAVLLVWAVLKARNLAADPYDMHAILAAEGVFLLMAATSLVLWRATVLAEDGLIYLWPAETLEPWVDWASAAVERALQV